jgi:hypothetical protein
LRRYNTFKAFGEMAAREIECSDLGMIDGEWGVEAEFKKGSSA